MRPRENPLFSSLTRCADFGASIRERRKNANYLSCVLDGQDNDRSVCVCLLVLQQPTETCDWKAEKNSSDFPKLVRIVLLVFETLRMLIEFKRCSMDAFMDFAIYLHAKKELNCMSCLEHGRHIVIHVLSWEPDVSCLSRRHTDLLPQNMLPW